MVFLLKVSHPWRSRTTVSVIHHLTRDQRILVHQVHPLKLAFDISASVISNTLLWKHQLVTGLTLRYLMPVAGSAIVMSFVDSERLAETAAARYVLTHMPPLMVALRLAGDTLMALGSWRRRPAFIALGVWVVAVGWSHGLLPRGGRQS